MSGPAHRCTEACAVAPAAERSSVILLMLLLGNLATASGEGPAPSIISIPKRTIEATSEAAATLPGAATASAHAPIHAAPATASGTSPIHAHASATSHRATTTSSTKTATRSERYLVHADISCSTMCRTLVETNSYTAAYRSRGRLL